MYFQQQILFPFEVFVKNSYQDDHVYLALSSTICLITFLAGTLAQLKKEQKNLKAA